MASDERERERPANGWEVLRLQSAQRVVPTSWNVLSSALQKLSANNKDKKKKL